MNSLSRFAGLRGCVLTFGVEGSAYGPSSPVSIDGSSVTDPRTGAATTPLYAINEALGDDGAELTLELWLSVDEAQPADATWVPVITWSTGSSDGPFPFSLYLKKANSGYDLFAYRIGSAGQEGVNTTTGDYNDGAWRQVTLVRSVANNTVTFSLYVDGALVGSPATGAQGSTGPSAAPSGQPLLFGYGAALPEGEAVSSQFAGRMSQVRLWNGALTTDQISQLRYSSLQGRVEAYVTQHSDPGDEQSPLVSVTNAQLVGSWRCDEGYGRLVCDHAGLNDGVFGASAGPPEDRWRVNDISQPPTMTDVLV